MIALTRFSRVVAALSFLIAVAAGALPFSAEAPVNAWLPAGTG